MIPESFWLGVIVQIAVGCGLLYWSRFAPSYPPSPFSLSRPAGPGESLTSPEAAEELPKLPNYDPDACGKVVKLAACVCVGLVVAELLILLLVEPGDGRCPGWIFHPNQPSALSLWVLAGMFTVLPAAWICNVALRWDHHYARKMYDSIAYGPPEQLLMNATGLVLMVTAGWCAVCAIPLSLMLWQCTDLPRYLNLDAFHF